MKQKLQRRFALSSKGADDTIRGSLFCALQNVAFMLPVGLLYCLVRDLLNGGLAGRGGFYLIACVACCLFIVVSTWLQYNGTFLATYVETGVRRVSLAEQLRRLPLSFFGKKDLADLTASIMNDCAVLETSQSHFVCPLIGACISTVLIALSLLAFDWRMALAAVWPLPVAFTIVALAARVQEGFSRRSMAARIACEDGIQEYVETMADLRANNAQDTYFQGLAGKIRAMEHRAIISEFGTATFVVSAGLVLRLGMATTALAGAWLDCLDDRRSRKWRLLRCDVYLAEQNPAEALEVLRPLGEDTETLPRLETCYRETGDFQNAYRCALAQRYHGLPRSDRGRAADQQRLRRHL